MATKATDTTATTTTADDDDDSTGSYDLKFKNPANLQQFADGNLEFALNLYQAIVDENGDTNLFCSPFSITAALAMTYAGARGKTADEMKNTMKLDAVEDVHLAMEEIQTSLNLGKVTGDKNLPFILHCANQMYVQENYTVTDGFVGTLTEHYGTRPELVNFLEKAEETRRQINKWVEEVTRDKIKELLNPDMVKPLTRMILVNAIYFKGTWSKQFDPKKTREEDFFVTSEDKTKVQMMHLKKKFPYAENEDLKCKILEMPYEGERLVIYFILPNAVEGLSVLEKQLTPSVFKNLKSELVQRSEVVVGIPKFKLESTVPLSDTLQTMGIREVFLADKADLSGITDNRELCVSAVIHKAFVEVNEEGTEAAAATAVVFMRCCAIVGPEFIANHPFLFVIYDKQTDLVLFLGRFKQPVE